MMLKGCQNLSINNTKNYFKSMKSSASMKSFCLKKKPKAPSEDIQDES